MSNPNLVRKTATSTISGESSFTDIAAAIGGSGGGGGTGKNYITTGSTFDGASTAGWSLTKATLDATTKVPNAAPSGSATGLSISTVGGGSQLSLSGYSLSLVSTGSTVAGDMLLSDAIALDQEAQSSVQTFSFFYKVASGSGNFSGTSSNTLGVAIYAVDGSSIGWIQPAGAFNIVQSSGVGKASGTFQVPAGCTSVRLAVYFPNSTASAIAIYLDDFVLGPQTVQYGAPVTDWVSYTPSIAGSVSNPTIPSYTIGNFSARYRRVGDSAHINFDFYCDGTVSGGAAGSGVYLFNLPPGLSIDTSKVYATSDPSASQILGAASAYSSDIAPTGRLLGYVTAYSSTKFAITITNGAGTAPSQVGSTFANISATGVKVYNFEAFVPVLGWSSSVQMSNDTDTRVVAARGTFAATSIPSQAVEGSETRIEFATTVFDTHSATTLTGATKFTAPVTGIYKFYGLLVEASANFIGAIILKVYKNGSQYNARSFRTNDLTALTSVFFNESIQLNAGDYVDLRVFQTSGSARNFTAASTWAIERLSGPSAIAATETVALKYKNTAGTTLGATATIPFATRVYDTHGAYNGTVFTAPISGTYLVNTSLGPNSVLLSTTQGQSITYKVTSTPEGLSAYQSGVFVRYGNGANTDAIMSASKMYKLNAGDTIEIQAASSVAVTLALATEVNTVQIVRVGN